MRMPTLLREKRLFSRGFESVIGIDEAGRGAWAGPLVAAVLMFRSKNIKRKNEYTLIQDSKLLTPTQREKAYEFLRKYFTFSIGVVSHKIIDSLGLNMANQEAMNQALKNLEIYPHYALVDGRGFFFDMPHENVIDGDFKVFSIAAASIIAKVTRDRIMREYDKKFPSYGFAEHKGYGTLYHRKMLMKYGVCPIHRKSYEPVRKLLR